MQEITETSTNQEIANILSSQFVNLETSNPSKRLELDAENVKNGLGQLVLTLIRLIHELLEKQAIRRIDAGSLSDEEIENVGLTLMKQAEEIDRLRKLFGLEKDDLNLDLGSLGKLL
jgi:hypothetical protein